MWIPSDATQAKIDQIPDAVKRANQQRAFDVQYRTGMLVGSVFGFTLLGLFVGTLLVCAAYRTVRYLFISRRRDGVHGPITPVARTLTQVPLIGKRRAQPWTALHGALAIRAPLRIHAFVIAAVWIATLLCFAVGYETFTGPDNSR